MVLDITSFREQEDPDVLGPDGVREIQRKRFKDVKVVDTIIAIDEQWRQCTFVTDKLNAAKNVCSNTIRDKMKAKEGQGDTDEIPQSIHDLIKQLTTNKASLDDVKAALAELCVKQVKNLSSHIDVLKADNKKAMEKHDADRQELLRSVGNELHESVPVHSDEEHNAIVRTVGKAAREHSRKKYSHVDLIVMIDGVDSERGVNAAGGRCYYLRGPGVCLEMALVSYALQFLMARKFTALSPPLFMRKDAMQKVAQLSQFDEELYKVTGKASEIQGDTAVEEKYLIATAEQPIAAYHQEETIVPKDVPLRYVGVSECFRQEVGSHGRDTTGIFRVHQFKKIEQFVITSPHDGESWKMMDEMLTNAEDFLKSLGLPYQVVNIVSGALNLAAAKKLDIEAWFPGSGAFRELVSCSNCTDYQARRLNIRYGQKKMNARTEHVHMLNSTLCATTRTICCILENFQVGDLESNGGIVVPEVLRPFMPDQYKEFIPFVKPAPIDEEAAKEAAKKEAAEKAAAKKAAKKDKKQAQKKKK
ncbi:seryl-tRNA synthetase [Salpingoeca rosetta]|uniref:serine--tRNA ligase n=1 Tax=Salpingoeca rosetta (strain ATCC 50818 / BSB-021) TaxID=946362 RepID=F2UIY8_SALR5|nr:seryl-tRNA synthetase [Salpingoeca rosetta]EGD76936.1 seryl-tRNA synthetase [Salpingoeca rosetta]|eukprot:XP_004990776.1 seryl-tRNA synthetase [Salpingoeca rosetta]